MKLSQNMEAILQQIHLDADMSTAALARRLGLHEHVVRYAIQRLEEHGIVRLMPSINVYPLGLMHYAIFFSLNTANKLRYEEMAQFLCASEKVSFVAELGGEFHLGMTLCIRDLKEISDFINVLSTRFGSFLGTKGLAARLKLTEYAPVFGDKKRTNTDSLIWGTSDKRGAIDETDHAIICQFRDVSTNSAQLIAKNLGLKRTTVEYRIARMRQAGIFVRTRYLLNAQALGRMNFQILIYVKSLSAKVRATLEQFALQHPAVVYLMENIGSWDFDLGVQTDNQRTVVQLSQSLYEHLGAELSEIKILPNFGYPKVANYPFRKYPFAAMP